MQEKYGFVYIWYDRKYNRYYIGCHWGTENDGYICSSTWMRNSYNRRKIDFRRKILKTNIQSRKELLEEEYKWLKLIKEEEIGKKYYNLHTRHFNHWSSNKDSILVISKKISESQKANPNFGKWNKGRIVSEKIRNKISESTSKSMIQYYEKNPRTEETRKKISENSKRLQIEGKIGTKGMKYSKESRKKMSERQLGKNNFMYGKKHTEETRKKISETLKRTINLKFERIKEVSQ